jgi:hypothetical protein
MSNWKPRTFILALVALALVVPAAALAVAPAVTTGAASAITSTSATVAGSVNPNGAETKYHFEYGTTDTYGTSTPEKSAGKGAKVKAVKADLVGLATSTTYHYRLVATNASGTVGGADMTFTTLAEGQAPPGGHAVTIAATPANIPFGGATTITGQVVGADNGNVAVTLESRAAGTTNFKNVGSGKTDATGNYSIANAPIVNTEYQVVAKTRPDATSPIQLVKVRFVPTLRLSDATPKRGKRVRFSGVVKPARDNTVVLIQRRKSGKFRTVTTALLTAGAAGESKYSKRLRIRSSGVYRVRVPADAQHAAGNTKRRRIRVH